MKLFPKTDCFNRVFKWRQSVKWCHVFPVLIVFSAGFNQFWSSAQAQVIPDQTLGTENSVVTPGPIINDSPAEQVVGGATRDSTLFHSFIDFNVLSGEQVYFANPIGIDQIISRVTGGSVSNIFGTLGVDGEADLYFLNPNGIVFGPDAQIDVRGTFVASTADSFVFADDMSFSAATPETPPLLSVAVAPGLQYGSQIPGSIVNGTDIAVGQNLILSAGSIHSAGTIFAPNGSVTVESVDGNITIHRLAAQSALLSATDNVLLTESQLWTVEDLQILAGNSVTVRDTLEQPTQLVAGGNLLVQGDAAIDIFALNHGESGLVAWGDMVLRSPNPIGGDAHYWTGGSFRIEDANGELGQLFSPSDPIIRAMGNVQFDSYLGTSLHILSAGSVTANFIVITGPETAADNVNSIEAPAPDGFSLALPGNPTTGIFNGALQPTLDIRAGMLPSQVGSSPVTVFGSPISGYNGSFNIPPAFMDNFFSSISTLVPPPIPSGNTLTADITISDVVIGQSNGKVLLTNAYQPNLALSGGDIRLGALAGTSPNPPPIPTPNPLSLTQLIPGVGIVALGVGGDGSDVVIAARQNIEVDNRNIFTSSDIGNAGNITLLADGDINVLGDPDDVQPEVSVIAATGNSGGDIEIESYTGNISIEAGTLTVAGEGSGNIRLTSNLGDIRLNDSAVGIFTSGSGGSGNINLRANSIILDEAAAVFNGAQGIASGGNINLQATDQLSITDRGTTRSPSLDNLEDVVDVLGLPPEILPDLPPPALLSTEGTGISTDIISGNGQGGDVVINVGQLRIENLSPLTSMNRAGITTTSPVGSNGNSGNVEITADVVKIIGNRLNTDGDPIPFNPEQNASDLPEIIGISTGITSATNGLGQAGTIQIDTSRLQVLADAGIASGNSLVSNGGDANDVTINATDSIELSGLAVIVSGTTGEGRAGDVSINIPAGDLTLSNGAIVAADTFGTGNAGGVEIDAHTINVLSGSRIGASTDGDGSAGSLVIPNASLVVVDGISEAIDDDDTPVPSRLFFSSTGTPDLTSDAGNLNVTTQELIVSNGGEITANTENTGDGGFLFLDAENVQVTGFSEEIGTGSRIAFESEGAGNAQGIEIVSNTLLVENQGEISVSANDAGNAGELRIDTQNLTVQTGGQVLGRTTDTGSGGLLLLEADIIQVNGPDSQINFESEGVGNARGIEIATDSLIVENQGAISVSGSGTGTSGDLDITANSIFLDQQAGLRSETRASEGGNIRLTVAGNIIMSNDGDPNNATLISASAFDDANGGNIEFDVGGSILAVLEENSDVLAFAERGQGGNITGDAGGIIYEFRDFQGEPSPESDFTAVATDPLGTNGNVNVPTALPEEPPLPDDFASDDIARGCIAASVPLNSPNPQSSFTFMGRGGLPSQPVAAQDTAALTVGLVDSVEPSKVPVKDDTNVEDYRGDSAQQPLLLSCIRP